MAVHPRLPKQTTSGDRRAFLKTLGMGTGTAFLGSLAACEQATSPPEAVEPPSHLVKLGNTDLYVSRMCQGTAFRTHLSRKADDAEAVKLLRHCMDIGVNFFNSAEAYGDGGAETTLGKAIAGRRHEVIVSTKAYHWSEGKRTTITKQNLMVKAEGSLERLGTDYIDLYLLHGPDLKTPSYGQEIPPPDTPTREHMEELADAMDALVKSGKVRYWGVSNHLPRQVAELMEFGKRAGKAPLVGLEDYYTIMAADRRDLMIKGMFPLIRQENLGLLAFSPLGGGHLVPGREPEEGSPLLDVIAVLDQVSKELRVTRPQVCVAWVAAHPEVTSVLAGGEKPEHVEEDLKGTTLALPAEAMSKLNSAADAYKAKLAAPRTAAAPTSVFAISATGPHPCDNAGA